MSCLVCGSKKEELKFQGIRDLEYGTYKPVNYLYCTNCGFISQNPIPSIDTISTFYPDEYRNYLPVKDSLFASLKKMWFKDLANKLTKDLNKDSLILEIGFGNGELLKALKKLGYENLYGLDFVQGNNSTLNMENIIVQYANAEGGIPFDKKFDLIIMNNVIEHFTDPFKVLKNCKAKLSDSGKVVLLTPNGNALEVSIFNKYWAGFHAPRHTFIFNSKNIKMTGEKLGFSQVKTEPITDPGQWSISIQNLFQNNKLTRTKLKNGMSWYLLPLSLAIAPIAVFQNAIGKSTSMMCTLKH